MVDKKEADVKETSTEETESVGENKEAAAQKLVHRYVLWSMGAGLIPVPWIDVGALAGVQLKMLHRLSQHYEVEFSKNRGKSIIAALLGTITAASLRRVTAISLFKAMPGVSLLGALSMPIYSGATTYAIGKVFIQHFESGGTFLDFDPQKVKEHFAKLYEEGKLVVSKLKTKKA